jgi:hypothetical protein
MLTGEDKGGGQNVVGTNDRSSVGQLPERSARYPVAYTLMHAFSLCSISNG